MNLDIIGIMFNNDGTYDNDGNTLTPPTQLSGWHVNTTELVPEWEEFSVNPSHKRRVFAGVETYCYKFESKEHADNLIKELIGEDE